MENTEEFTLAENQKNFFAQKRQHIENCMKDGNSEALGKQAHFLLNQMEEMLIYNEKLKKQFKDLVKNIEQQNQDISKKISIHKQREYRFFNAMKSIYRMVDRTAGPEIRNELMKNDITMKEGQMKKLMAEMDRLSA